MKTDKWYEKIEKKFIQVQTANYNKHMSGGDLFDAFLSYYRINVWSKKCYHGLLWHFFDLALVKGSILHKKVLEEDSLCLKNFKLSFADVLLLAEKVE